MDILIGDDHPLFREGIQRLLETNWPDATIRHCGDFDGLVEALGRGPMPDLVMTDLQMPGWPGFEGIAQLRRLCPDSPLVVVSASEDGADMRASVENGASGFIPKSSGVGVMLGALELVLAGGAYLPPSAFAWASEAQPGLSSGPSPARRPGPAQPRGESGLTQRQSDVLSCLRAGKSNKQIASDLGLSEGTVKIHVTAIFKALGVKNRTQAVITAAQMGGAG
jgi:DNA-binding NarL/FixJ family response regulator